MAQKSLVVSGILLLLFTRPLLSLTQEEYRNGSTWYAPISGTAIIECWGGGGAGGISNSGEGGGGGGAYARATVTLGLNARYVIQIGAGGGFPGMSGQDSLFQSWPENGDPRITYVLAAGGISGQGRVGGAGGEVIYHLSIGDVIYPGGNGATSIGGNAGGGGGGSSAGSDSAGGNGFSNNGSAGGAGGLPPLNASEGGYGGDLNLNGEKISDAEYLEYFGSGGGGGGKGGNAGSGILGRCVITY
jgi:hypothetical protein